MTFADITDGSSNVIAVGEVSETANVTRTMIDRVFPFGPVATIIGMVSGGFPPGPDWSVLSPI